MPGTDTTPHGSQHILLIDALHIVENQEAQNIGAPKFIGRKITHATWEKMVKKANENSVILLIERDRENDTISLKEKEEIDEYAIAGSCNASS